MNPKILPNIKKLALLHQALSEKQYLFCFQLTFLYALKNSPPYFQTWTPTHTDTHTSFKDPGRDKEKQREKRANGEWGRRRGESRECDKTVQRVYGDRRPMGTREVEKRIQVLSNVQISHSRLSLYFLFFFVSIVNHPFCKPTLDKSPSLSIRLPLEEGGHKQRGSPTGKWKLVGGGDFHQGYFIQG